MVDIILNQAPGELPFALHIVEDAVFAAIASIGFASISHTPQRTYILCALAAALGHALRFILMNGDFFHLDIVLASSIAAFVIGVIAVVCSPTVKVPAEACLFPALLPMIPGMYAYRTVEALVCFLRTSTEELASHYLYLLGYNGFTCAAILLGMVIGANIPIFMLKHISFQATC